MPSSSWDQSRLFPSGCSRSTGRPEPGPISPRTSERAFRHRHGGGATNSGCGGGFGGDGRHPTVSSLAGHSDAVSHLRPRSRWTTCGTPQSGTPWLRRPAGSSPSPSVPSTGPRTPVAALHQTVASTPVAAGPVLEQLHEALAGLVRALSGRMLVPSFAVYGYFPEADGVVLHLDTDATDIVLLTTALGEVGPLVLHPDLERLTPSRLGNRESDPRWDPGGGMPLVYPSLGVATLHSLRIPHGRPPRPVATLSAVATLHYRSPYLTEHDPGRGRGRGRRPRARAASVLYWPGLSKRKGGNPIVDRPFEAHRRGQWPRFRAPCRALRLHLSPAAPRRRHADGDAGLGPRPPARRCKPA